LIPGQGDPFAAAPAVPPAAPRPAASDPAPSGGATDSVAQAMHHWTDMPAAVRPGAPEAEPAFAPPGASLDAPFGLHARR
jgi:hypothetical protein